VLAGSDVTELSDVAGGRAPGRTEVDDVTVFKSVGVAFEDLVVAAAAVSRST
jgi:ornithine cyclodeaminase/alanine dehydrogenase-like protein (mu-crystallin family)